MQVLRKPITLPLVLFLVSAFVGAWISYNPATAWQKFALIVTGVGIYMFLQIYPEQTRIGSMGQISSLRFTLALLPLVVIAYFVVTNDWTSRLGKLSWVDPILRSLATSRLWMPGFQLNSNSFGGVLAALVPLQIAALVQVGKLRWVGFGLVLISAVGLLLSESRGAWIAVAMVAGIWVLWKLSGQVARRWIATRQQQTRIAICAVVLVLVALVGTVVALTPQGQNLLQRRSDRLTVWQNSLDLASDYPFTGLGLGGFDMAYSSYVLLLHVSYVVHAHNLYLDVWLEQGLLGLFAFAGLVVGSVLPIVGSILRGEQVGRWQIAALASLGVILLHGSVDDPFYGYGGAAIPFLFVPLGLLAGPNDYREMAQRPQLLYRAPILGGTLLVLLVLVVTLPWIRSSFLANLGSLLQTRAELSVYDWPKWPIQDELRRSRDIDLSFAIGLYENALAIDPSNASANRRLGQIELSRGEYGAAQAHLEGAYAMAPSQRATRQMLGELYAIGGKQEQAIALWKKTDVSNDQLVLREWWYEHIGEQKRAGLVREAARCCGG